MKSATATPNDRATPAAGQQPEGLPGNTPNADMQAEDTGSAQSGDGDGDGADSATAATRAMKQTSKTPAESGGKR